MFDLYLFFLNCFKFISLFAVWMILHDLVTQMVNVDMGVDFCS